MNINRVIITGNLTKDPELRSLPSGTTVCGLRLAVNGRRKNQQTGAWEEFPNYFDVSIFGASGENAAKYLSRGRPVAIDGRLRWREWTTEDGQKRQAVDIIADNVQFLGGGQQGQGGGQQGGGESFSRESDIPVDRSDFEPAGVGGGSGGGTPPEDIPF